MTVVLATDKLLSLPKPNSYNNNSVPLISQESSPPAVKLLPLAPILLSTPPHDRRGNNNAAAAANVSIRRGSSIFSPNQTTTIDPHPTPTPVPPPPPQKELPTPDPDPASSTTTTNLKNNIITTPQPKISYRECLKNHAANIGGHVVDGCGEFMPSGEENTPQLFLQCAACNCHRNFHRKEIEGCCGSGGEPQQQQQQQQQYYYRNNNNSSLLRSSSRPHGPPTMVNFGGAESSSEGRGNNNNNNVEQFSSGGSKKRFRSKFSPEQKDRMQDFAVKLGWRMQKQDDGEVQQFCNEVGVKRQVFKVWMHNNKQAMKKRQI